MCSPFATPLAGFGGTRYNSTRMYRSRLQRLEEKRDMRTAVIIFGAVILLLIFLGFVGIKFLPKLVNMLSNSKRVNTDKIDLISPPPPSLTLPYFATFSATIDITGQSEPESLVYLTQNGDSKGNQKTQGNGLFVFPQIALSEGNNSFRLVAMDPAGNQSPASQIYLVEYISKAPELNIEMPQDGQTVSSKRLTIKGTTNPQNKLIINGRWVTLDSSGIFETILNLNAGENKILFVATNRAGGETQKEITVNLE